MGIDERRLPAGSIVRFREPTAWELWKWYALGALALLVLQSSMIMWLLVHRAARRRAQRALTERLRFEALLSDLSATLVAAHGAQVDREIEKLLGRMGEELPVDRAAVGECDAQGTVPRITHAWTRHSIAATRETIPVDRVPWIAGRLRAGHVVAIRSLDELPAEAARDQRSLTESGTRSLAVVPLTVGSGVAGLLWFETQGTARPWPEELLQRLRLLGEMLANALARRGVESALRESEARFRSLADTAPVLIWMSGPDKGCTFFNRPWLEFTGRALEQELGTGWVDGVHADDVDQCLRGYVEAFDARRGFTLEYRLRRRDGRYRWVLDHGVPRFAEDGVFIGYIGCAYEITDLKQAEERPRQILEATPNAMIMVTAEGTIALVNAAAERVFGYERAELIGRPIERLIPGLWRDRDLIRHHEAVAEAAARALDAGQELYGLRKDGRQVPIEIGLAPIETPEKLFVLASIADITDRKEAELDAQLHRAELAHVTRVATMGELAASLAHELNQPLTAILSNAQAAQRFLDSDPVDLKEVSEILQDIVQDNRRAGDVIHRLRALVRKEELDAAPLDVASIIRDVFVLTHSDAILRGSRVSLELDAALPTVRGDRVQLQQVILNLLLNAFDAMNTVSPDQRHVSVTAGLDGTAMVRIAVRDRGIGIRDDMLDEIFQPFFTTKREGLGMGLSISRSIIRAHQGRLWAENNPDGGAIFTFTLPVYGDDSST
jgi:two-component system sensor kinase FixL